MPPTFEVVHLLIWVGVPALATVFVAWIGFRQQAQARQIEDLQLRLAAVEEERDAIRQLLRSAIRHIRDWMEWSRTHIPGVPPPPLPDDLRDEV